MASVVRLDADLDFSVDDGPRSLAGTIRAEGRHVELRVEGLTNVVGAMTSGDIRRLAAGLARQDLTLAIGDSSGSAITIGALRTSLLSRILSRSKHMRIDSFRAAAALAKAQRSAASGPVLLDGVRLPPGTMLPMFPTARRKPRGVTTTHGAASAGNPRLYLVDASNPDFPSRVGVFELRKDSTTIGSGPGMDLHLEGVDDFQAEVVRDENDEFALVARSARILSTVSGQQLPRQVLRTGSRIELGPWRMAYVRDENADHGRPYGGRIGGELGHQRTQLAPPYRKGTSF